MRRLTYCLNCFVFCLLQPYVLRNSILTIITEVILNVLTKHELGIEEREHREDFLRILEEHIHDSAALVRAKVCQNWARLQAENAIPLNMIHRILDKIVQRLGDKGALVRKAAASCVTDFLKHNPYGPKVGDLFY